MRDSLPVLHSRVIGLDVHQVKIHACLIDNDEHGEMLMEHREFGAFKRDRRELALWVASHGSDAVVMESTGISNQSWSQDRCGGCPMADYARTCRVTAAFVHS